MASQCTIDSLYNGSQYYALEHHGQYTVAKMTGYTYGNTAKGLEKVVGDSGQLEERQQVNLERFESAMLPPSGRPAI